MSLHVNAAPSPRELRTFGLLLPVFAAAAGSLLAHRTGSVAAGGVVWAGGAALAVAYLALPGLRRPVFVGASYAAAPIGWVVSHLLLLVIFWGVITPIGVLVRLFGDDPLERRMDKTADTYWARRDDVAAPRRYFQQF